MKVLYISLFVIRDTHIWLWNCLYCRICVQLKTSWQLYLFGLGKRQYFTGKSKEKPCSNKKTFHKFWSWILEPCRMYLAVQTLSDSDYHFDIILIVWCADSTAKHHKTYANEFTMISICVKTLKLALVAFSIFISEIETRDP